MSARSRIQPAKTEHRHQSKQANWQAIVPMAGLLAIAVALGGGGVRYGLSNFTIQAVALGILAFHFKAFTHFWASAPWLLRILTGLTVLVPALHIVPLPESIWSALPGRDLVVQSRELIGVSGWAPASLDPARSLVALTGLIVPLTILTVGWSLTRRNLLTLGWVIVALGCVCFLLGVPQVLSAGTSGVFYSERGPTGLLYGTFANRNSTGVFLVSTLALAALLPYPLAQPAKAALPIRLAICGLLALGVVLTQSRTAFVLAGIPITLGLVKAVAAKRVQKRSGGQGSQLAIFAAIGLGIAGLGGTLALAPGPVGETLERFEAIDDARAYIWEDAAYSAGRHWPMGAGMGTFDEVFQVDESLENLTRRRAGRAHNDYIELALEAGIIGLALAAAWLCLAGWLSWKAGASNARWAGWACGAILLAIALQSVTDYPLRNQTMLAVAAFAMLMLARVAQGTKAERAS